MIDDLLQALVELFDSDVTLMLILASSLCLSAVGFIIYSIRQGRLDLSRRIAPDEAPQAAPASGPGKVSGLVAQFADNVDETSAKDRKVLRHRLIQAGLNEPGAASWYIVIRLACIPLFALAGFFLVAWLKPAADFSFISIATFGAAIIGYLAPDKLLDRRIGKLRMEHQDGFPDFMDLMVVCCQAGLSMEAAINRVAGELQVAYPSLARNLQLCTAELRGGLALAKAIDSLSKRLGIAEALSFSTLLQQSEELGSSLTQSLRAYSDDMRNKRLMRAEEKAHALPAKLVIPLTLFVFPVIMVVIMLPVVIGVAASMS